MSLEWSRYQSAPMKRCVIELHCVVARSENGTWQWWCNESRGLVYKRQIGHGGRFPTEEEATQACEYFCDSFSSLGHSGPQAEAPRKEP